MVTENAAKRKAALVEFTGTAALIKVNENVFSNKKDGRFSLDFSLLERPPQLT
jgi:hypothetical protein